MMTGMKLKKATLGQSSGQMEGESRVPALRTQTSREERMLWTPDLTQGPALVRESPLVTACDYIGNPREMIVGGVRAGGRQ